MCCSPPRRGPYPCEGLRGLRIHCGPSMCRECAWKSLHEPRRGAHAGRDLLDAVTTHAVLLPVVVDARRWSNGRGPPTTAGHPSAIPPVPARAHVVVVIAVVSRAHPVRSSRVVGAHFHLPTLNGGRVDDRLLPSGGDEVSYPPTTPCRRPTLCPSGGHITGTANGRRPPGEAALSLVPVVSAMSRASYRSRPARRESRVPRR